MGEINFAGVGDDALLEALGRKRLGGQLADVSDEDLMAALGQQTPAAEPVLPLEQPFALSQQLGGQLPQLPGPTELSPGEQAMRARLAEIGQMASGGIGAAAQPQPGRLGIEQIPEDIVGPTIGEAVGAGAGAMMGPAAPVAVPALASLGSVAGLNIERLIRRGQVPTIVEQMVEGGFSLVPEVVEQGARAIGRQFIKRGSQVGDFIRSNLMAQRAATEAPALLSPPSKELLQREFDAIRQAGVTVSPEPFLKPVRDMSEGAYGRLKRELKRIGSTPSPDIPSGLGERMINTLDSIRKGGPRAGFDIGELQATSSQLKARLRSLSQGAPQAQVDTLNDAIDMIEGAIDSRLTIGRRAAGDIPERLDAARAGWRRLKASEELGAKITESFTKSVEGGDFLQFDLDKFHNFLRAPKSRADKRLAATLDSLGVKDQLFKHVDELRKIAPKMRVQWDPLQIPTFGRFLGEVMAQRAGRDQLENIIVSGRGTMQFPGISLLSSVIRRSAVPQTFEEQISGAFGAGPI